MSLVILPVTVAEETVHHILEFNVSLPMMANRAIPITTSLDISERFVIPYSDETQNNDNMKLVKLNLVHRINYADINGISRLHTTQHSITIQLPNSGNNPDTTYYHSQELANVIVPASSKVTQSHINNPTDTTGNNGCKNNCVYSIYKLTTSNYSNFVTPVPNS